MLGSRELVTEVQIVLLQSILATSYTLALKTQNYHWNVEGGAFYELHLLFEKQYNELVVAIDEIAETIRTCGHKAYATFKKYSSASVIEEGNEHAGPLEMITDLAQSNAKLIELLMEASEMWDDNSVVDLLTRRIEIHRKNLWMLDMYLTR